MKVNDVTILNHYGPRYWPDCEAKPDEPLIEAVLTMTLSLNQYKSLCSGGLPAAPKADLNPGSPEK